MIALCSVRNVVGFAPRADMDEPSELKPYAVLPSRHHRYAMRTLFEGYWESGEV